MKTERWIVEVEADEEWSAQAMGEYLMAVVNEPSLRVIRASLSDGQKSL